MASTPMMTQTHQSTSRIAFTLGTSILGGSQPLHEAARFAPRYGGVAPSDASYTKSDRTQSRCLAFRESASLHDTGQGSHLYSRSPVALVDQHQLVELFATHAGLAMGRVRTVGGLLVALGTRKVIGQAIGITMARDGIDEERAFDFLIRVSQGENVKLRDVAVGVVNGALSDREETSTPAPNGH